MLAMTPTMWPSFAPRSGSWAVTKSSVRSRLTLMALNPEVLKFSFLLFAIEHSSEGIKYDTDKSKLWNPGRPTADEEQPSLDRAGRNRRVGDGVGVAFGHQRVAGSFHHPVDR